MAGYPSYYSPPQWGYYPPPPPNPTTNTTVPPPNIPRPPKNSNFVPLSQQVKELNKKIMELEQKETRGRNKNRGPKGGGGNGRAQSQPPPSTTPQTKQQQPSTSKVVAHTDANMNHEKDLSKKAQDFQKATTELVADATRSISTLQKYEGNVWSFRKTTSNDKKKKKGPKSKSKQNDNKKQVILSGWLKGKKNAEFEVKKYTMTDANKNFSGSFMICEKGMYQQLLLDQVLNKSSDTGLAFLIEIFKHSERTVSELIEFLNFDLKLINQKWLLHMPAINVGNPTIDKLIRTSTLAPSIPTGVVKQRVLKLEDATIDETKDESDSDQEEKEEPKPQRTNTRRRTNRGTIGDMLETPEPIKELDQLLQLANATAVKSTASGDDPNE